MTFYRDENIKLKLKYSYVSLAQVTILNKIKYGNNLTVSTIPSLSFIHFPKQHGFNIQIKNTLLLPIIYNRYVIFMEKIPHDLNKQLETPDVTPEETKNSVGNA